MEQPDNLLSSFIATEKHPASFWLERCGALNVAGLENYRTTMAAILDAQDAETVKMAGEALRIIEQIVKQLHVTHEAIREMFQGLQKGYIEVRNALATEKGVRKNDDPRAQLLHDYTALHISCQARAAAIIPTLNAEIAKHRASSGAEPATGRDDGLDLIRQIVEEASSPTKPGGVSGTPR